MKHKELRGFTRGKEKAHPGFHAVQEKIAKQEGVSMDAAGAATKKANPALKRVKG